MRAVILATLGAGCHVLIYPPFGFSWLTWIAPLPVLAMFPAPSATRAAAAVWFFGTLWALGVVTPWMTSALGALFDLSLLGTAGLLFLVCQAGIPFALLGFLLHAGRPKRPIQRVLYTAAAWVSVEYLRAHVPFGTPWALLGLALAETPAVIQVADLGGPYAVSFLAAAVSAALAELADAWREARSTWPPQQPAVEGDLPSNGAASVRARLPAVALAGALVAAALWYGEWRRTDIAAQTAAAPHAEIALIHADIVNTDRQDPARGLANIERYLALVPSETRGLDLIVWPENAVAFLLEENPDIVRRIAARGGDTPQLVGAPRMTEVRGRPALQAAAFLIDHTGIRGVYDKHRLLALAETMPAFGGGGLGAAQGFVPGAGPSMLATQRLRFGPLVCYEFIFPELARTAVREGAELLFNISNDSWFQPGAGPAQHFLFGRLRAVEVRRALVRAANRGPTAVVMPDGIATVMTDGLSPGTELVRVPRLEIETVYARWGDAFAWGCLTLTAVFVLRTRRLKN